jgi:8-oxo-dGTP pyrophosphatase MutT (NUDIX family)
LEFKHIEVYLFRRRPRPRILVLRRSAGHRLPGVWQPVTGTLRRGESIFRAAAREVREETGLTPECWWLLEAPTLHYDRQGRLLALPRFAAEVGIRQVVRLSAEHDAHAFVAPGTAARRFLWDSQREALGAIGRQVLRGGVHARALEIPSRRFRGRGPRGN